MKETGENSGFFAGAERVSLEDVLAFREEKAQRQKKLLAEYGVPLLCLGLNMPGEYKRFPLAARSFCEELKAVRLSLASEGIAVIHAETFEAAGGYAAFITAAYPPEKLKEIAVSIEDRHPLGRLFDIDVLREDGEKISRGSFGKQGRPCLICGGDAFACGRSRAHSAEELRNAAAALMAAFQRERLADLIAAAALKALIGEAAVTPKPGLVDRINNGAHRDMDFFSFIDSTAAIIPYFRNCALAGFNAAEIPPEEMRALPLSSPGHPAALFNSLRPAGKSAGLSMLEATGGANTHRGLIFSIGLASASFGVFFRHREQIAAEEILDFIASMTCRVRDDFSGGELSHGEVIHRRYGIGGVREEAARGFPAVRDALPLLRRNLSAGYTLNDAGLAVFLRLLISVADTNIIHRSGPETLLEIQKNASAFLSSNPGPAGMAEYAAEMDREFIAKNISPGGCADLLALTLFLHWLLLPGKFQFQAAGEAEEFSGGNRKRDFFPR
ncbi:MAG: citrate lyase holo-[acyl-carrier protein] synthase [Treponema sp.]|jgi:holo-ACP synthase/triphosphoribosyl-dephospho-CoA synthase|nr:citrate lyase holo-[acyl-carrier protein] synthase [Treponema sp.]